MKHFFAKNVVAALALAAGLSLSATAKAETVGVSLANISQFNQVDGNGSDGYIVTQAFAAAGEHVNTFQFYAAHSGSITPVLFTLSGNTFTLLGEGTTRTNAGAGIFTYSFGLTYGVNTTTANTYFGFINGGISNVAFAYTHGTNSAYNGAPALNNDVITYLISNPGLAAFTYTPNGSTGENNVGGAAYREYAINATTTPEPSSLALLGTGLAGIGGLVKRRFKRS